MKKQSNEKIPEFIELDREGMMLVAKILDIRINGRKCPYCGEKLTKENNGGIYPPINKKEKARVICKSVLCMVQLFEDEGW